MLSTDRIISIVVSVVLVMFSAIVHEVAHGWVALKCGDQTAKRAGRLTLDPRAHLDGFGSIVLPLLMAAMGGPMFAFAKPVPYNPYNLKHRDRDEVFVAVAGPISNILQALLGCAILTAVYTPLSDAYVNGVLPYEVARWAIRILTTYIYVNLCLAFFNLIPLPPLDGSKIVMPYLKGQAREKYYALQAYAMPILLILLYGLPYLLPVDPLSIYLDFTAGNLYDLLISVAVG